MTGATDRTLSAKSIVKQSLVLSLTVEENLRMQKEVSRLRHHVSVLSKRLSLSEKKNAELGALLEQSRKNASVAVAAAEVARADAVRLVENRAAEAEEKARMAVMVVESRAAVAEEREMVAVRKGRVDGEKRRVAVCEAEEANRVSEGTLKRTEMVLGAIRDHSARLMDRLEVIGGECGAECAPRVVEGGVPGLREKRKVRCTPDLWVESRDDGGTEEAEWRDVRRVLAMLGGPSRKKGRGRKK